MACDGKGGPMDSVRSTATSAAEGRLKVSLMDRKKKKLGAGVTPGPASVDGNTTVPARRNLQRVLDEKKGIGI